MNKCLALLLMFGPPAFGQDVASSAASPYDLAKFVETHSNFDWKPLWLKLGITDEKISLPRCDAGRRGVAPCSAELIAAGEPLQMIVLLEHNASMFQVCLRYQNVGPGAWRFAGAYAPFVKYFQPEHRLVRFGEKPFFIATRQGEAGTGLSTKVEDWIDLTREQFEPVLSFTSEGRMTPLPEGIERTAGGLVAALDTEPAERITVAFHIGFAAVLRAGETVPLGTRTDDVAYVRAASGRFEIDPSRSTASPQDVETFYNDLDSKFSGAEFLKFHLKGLTAVASGRDAKARRWLTEYLQSCPDTPESKRLKALLRQPM
jgi:hypothetical protein